MQLLHVLNPELAQAVLACYESEGGYGRCLTDKKNLRALALVNEPPQEHDWTAIADLTKQKLPWPFTPVI
jgi:hypothetical protein